MANPSRYKSKMKKILFAVIFQFLAGAPFLLGQPTAVETGIKGITQDVLKAQLDFLASDWTEGRETGYL